MAHRLTNTNLTELLLDLGFEQGGPAEKNHRTWRHPESGCTLLLPVNKALESPRAADLVGIKAQLDMHGHVDEDSFEYFVREGHLPVHPSGARKRS